jgi:hypothetical protein
MKRQRWAGTLNEKKGKPTAKNCRMRSKTRKLVKEVPGLTPKVQYAEDADQARLGRVPQRGNFSFYPTLFIASQEMFVNSGFRVPRTVHVLSSL